MLALLYMPGIAERIFFALEFRAGALAAYGGMALAVAAYGLLAGLLRRLAGSSGWLLAAFTFLCWQVA